LALAGFLIAYQFVDPAPPRSLTIASGPEDGAYARFADRYRDILAAEGIELKIRHTRGSLENLRLLGSAAVDVAFVQGGTGGEIDPGASLYSLGSLYFEPGWLFYRGEQAMERITELKGKRLAIGEPGSGTRALALTLIRDNGLDGEGIELVESRGQAAAQALGAGEIDAAFFVSGADSPTIEALIRNPDLRLMSFRRGRAYARSHPFISEVLLPEGLVDMRANIPDRDVHLLAPAANLVVRQALHPALQDLLVQAAKRVHGRGDWFERKDRFPAPDLLVFPLSPEAERFYEHGPPLLQRYLPFWAATLADRLKVMLLPALVILLPLIRAMPPIYRWRMRAKIYRWYRALEEVERLQRKGMDEAGRARGRRELERIEAEVRRVHVPLSFAAQAYDLRMHIRLVRDALLGDGRHASGPASELRRGAAVSLEAESGGVVSDAGARPAPHDPRRQESA
jgi:TRAP transporter TAXI family solute receptor